MSNRFTTTTAAAAATTTTTTNQPTPTPTTQLYCIQTVTCTKQQNRIKCNSV